MVRSWNPAFKGFTFAETLVAVALLILSAGLATQLLFSSLVFTQSHEASQKRFRSLLSLKTGLLASTSRVLPPSWAHPENSFVRNGDQWRMDYWDGEAGKTATLTVDAEGYFRWTDPEGSMVWGPWAGGQAAFWRVEERIAGLQITFTDRGETKTLRFPWGAWPL